MNIKGYIALIIVAVLVTVGVVSVVNTNRNLGSGSGQDHYSYETFLAGANIVGLNTGGVVTVATTSATYTLTYQEMSVGNTISITDTANSAALALTLPTGANLRKLLPATGESRTWNIQNLHSAAATTTTITTNTNVQLEGLTANDDIINGAVTGRLTCWNINGTDVACQVMEFVSAE